MGRLCMGVSAALKLVSHASCLSLVPTYHSARPAGLHQHALQLASFVGVLQHSYSCSSLPLPAGILLACKDKSASSSSLKIEALTFLRAAMESNASAVFQPHVAQLSSGVFTAVGERYYKVR